MFHPRIWHRGFAETDQTCLARDARLRLSCPLIHKGERMKLLAKTALAALIAAAPAAPAAAQAVIEGNGARSEGRWGGELGLGYRVRIGSFSITPAAGGFFMRGDNDRYQRETFSNGQTRCRDTTNGQFADDEKCINVDVRAYGRVEAAFSIPGAVEIGGGVRISARARPYGTIAVPIGPSISFKGNAGPDYAALGLRAVF